MTPAAIMGHNPFAAFHIHSLQQNQAFQPGNAGPMNWAFDPWKHSNDVPRALHPSLSVQTGVVTTAGPPDDLSNNTLSVQTAVSTSGNPIHGGFAVQTAVTANTAPTKGISNKTMTVQTVVTTNVMQPDVHPDVHPDAQQGVQPDVQADVQPDVQPDVTVTVNKPPAKKARTTPPDVKPVEEEEEEDLPNFKDMEKENAAILGQDDPSPWKNGVARFNADRASAAKVLAWLVENTSRKLSVIATDALTLDGFHNWDAVHAGALDDERQLQHTFVIARAERHRALKVIPGLAQLVDASKAAIESLHLKDTPKKLEWLTGHILNQGDVNARFEWHQDTNEERKEMGGRRDRRVLYSAIVKLNRGGCTSMQVCGKPEVYYHSPEGNGVLFRSDLHHRTEKAEPGVWKLAMFFGVFR